MKTVEKNWRPGPVGFGDRRGDRKGGWEGQERAGRVQNWTMFFFWPKIGSKIGHHPGDPVHSAPTWLVWIKQNSEGAEGRLEGNVSFVSGICFSSMF